MAVIEEVEEKISEIEENTSDYDKSRWIVFLVYIVVSYVLSLSVNEGLMLDLGGLKEIGKSTGMTTLVWSFGVNSKEKHCTGNTRYSVSGSPNLESM